MFPHRSNVAGLPPAPLNPANHAASIDSADALRRHAGNQCSRLAPIPLFVPPGAVAPFATLYPDNRAASINSLDALRHEAGN